MNKTQLIQTIDSAEQNRRFYLRAWIEARQEKDVMQMRHCLQRVKNARHAIRIASGLLGRL